MLMQMIMIHRESCLCLCATFELRTCFTSDVYTNEGSFAVPNTWPIQATMNVYYYILKSDSAFTILRTYYHAPVMSHSYHFIICHSSVRMGSTDELHLHLACRFCCSSRPCSDQMGTVEYPIWPSIRWVLGLFILPTPSKFSPAYAWLGGWVGACGVTGCTT